MKQQDYLVDVLDAQGDVVGQKRRHDIDKRRDIFHSVHVILVTPQSEAVLSLIPAREELPNLYAGLLGTTMATIRHHGETAEDAARRGVSRELLLDRVDLVLVQDGLTTLSDGRLIYLTAYKVVAEYPGLYRDLDIGELVKIDTEGVDVALELHADRFAPTLKAVWPGLQTRGAGTGMR